MSYTRLQLIQDAWAARHPRRAAGGAVSLAGFLYQFEVTLLAAVRCWLRDPDGPWVLVEALSDLTQPNPSGGWLITQIKRTGSSGSVGSALDELWTVHEVATEVDPEFLGMLTYEVRCARWDLADLETRMNSWRQNQSEKPAALDRFLARLRITTEPHPIDHLLTLLANELRCVDPLAWIRQHVGLLTQLAAGRSARDDVSRAIFSNLATLRNSQQSLPSGIRIVAPIDREPDSFSPGGYLVGEAPRLRHLREGYFAPRAWQVAPLVSSFIAWVESDPFANDRSHRIPVFWVGGRSGCGKSVLLLQMIARLNELGFGPLVWLAHNAKILPTAIEWALVACRSGRQSAVALDDPYAPGIQADVREHWEDAVSALESARDDEDRVPLVIACGPSEQAKALARDLSDSLQIHLWIVDDAKDHEHLDELQGWFEARTGHPAPEAGRGDVLMVQRFFEWRTGEPLGTFAARFRSRVTALDPDGTLVRFVAVLLATNRLYAGLPLGVRSILTPAAQDGLDRLRSDHHIAVDAEGGRPGLWLTHPHLSDALFRGWFRDDDANQQLQSLQDGIELCVAHGVSPSQQTAPLWAIWRAWTAEPDDLLHGRLDRDRCGAMLASVYSEEQSTGIPLFRIPVWIHLSRTIQGLMCRPDPADYALDWLERVRLEDGGVRLTCHILLGHLGDLGGERGSRVQRVIRTILDDSPEWHEWPHVAMHLARATGAASDGKRLVAWVQRHERSRMVPWLLYAALQIEGVSDDAYQLALQRADRASADLGWARLYEVVARRSTEAGRPVPEEVRLWTSRNRTAARALFVLRSLLESGVDESEQLARDWLAANPEAPPANYLIELLIRRADVGPSEIAAAVRWVRADWVGADRIIEWLLDHPGSHVERTTTVAREWLIRHPDAPGTPFVLRKLFDAVRDEGARQELVHVGTAWLVGREDRPEWAFVLQKLLDLVQDEARQELIHVGAVWLAGREDRPEWNFVLRKLLDLVQDEGARQQLVRVGTGWLAGREDRPEWNFVLRKLLDLVQDEGARQQLVRAGTGWLTGQEDRPEWAFVLQKMLDLVQDEAREELIHVGTVWLAGREDRPEWNFVLRKLLDLVQDEGARQQLVRVGTDWLAGREDRPEWNFVLRKLLDLVQDEGARQQLVRAGTGWLTGQEDRPEWAFVLQKLLDLVQDEARQELIHIGTGWLADREDRPEWAFVLQKLLDLVQDDGARQELVRMGTRWLAGREDRPEWNFVLQKLLDLVRDDGARQHLVHIGTGWLAGREDRPEWNFVLQKLLDLVRDEGPRQELVRVGTRWLAGREDRTQWTYVLEKLLDLVRDEGPREELVRVGTRWLAGREDRPDWSFVLQKLLDLVRDEGPREELVRVGTGWLAGREDRPGWSFVLRKLLDLVQDEGARQELIFVGTGWLGGRENRSDWDFVLQKLLDVARQPDQLRALIDWGRDWMSTHPNHRGASRVRVRVATALAQLTAMTGTDR